MDAQKARRAAAKSIAEAFLAGPLDPESGFARVSKTITASHRAIAALVLRLLQHFGASARPRTFRVERFVWEDKGFQRFSAKEGFTVDTSIQWPRAMHPGAGKPSTWSVLPITTIGQLASTLNLTPSELAWFADMRGLEAKVPAGPLRHYRYQWIRKRDGSPRLIEAPKPRLKAIQLFLLRAIVERITPHESAHAFQKGKSIRSFTSPHAARHVVLKVDLKGFFTSISRARALSIFLTAGYPEPIAETLAALSTNITPPEVLNACPANLGFRSRAAFRIPHLPQGAPASPALANLSAFRLDCRLAGLARVAGAEYTRYADDLVFSGDAGFARGVERFSIAVYRTIIEEGFEVNARKTRIMRRSVSQRAAGLVLNAKPNISRREYDTVKAILWNACKNGLEAENRHKIPHFFGHLAGRVAYFEQINPARGKKLRHLLDRCRLHLPGSAI